MTNTSAEDPALLTIQRCKLRAAALLKDLRSGDTALAQSAAVRLRALPQFREQEPAAIVRLAGSIRLDHALTVIAIELGHASWSDCQRALSPPGESGLDTGRFFATRGAENYLNRWFAHYSEALASLGAEGGFLFPFRQQFFICDTGFLSSRGIDPDDPDWTLIGRNWVDPADPAARDRLERKLLALGYGDAPVS